MEVSSEGKDEQDKRSLCPILCRQLASSGPGGPPVARLVRFDLIPAKFGDADKAEVSLHGDIEKSFRTLRALPIRLKIDLRVTTRFTETVHGTEHPKEK